MSRENEDTISWRVPADAYNEPCEICAVGRPGEWKFFRKYAMEIAWTAEQPSEELIRHADELWQVNQFRPDTELS
jgi:hypothetical protein